MMCRKNKITSSLKNEKKDLKDIWRRVKNKDFSGYTGLAIKNSFFQFWFMIVSKAGSLIFTIILARLISLEMFGNYSLALATIVIFSTFSNFGIDTSLTRFLSKFLAKKNKFHPKSYTKYFFNLRIYLMIISAGILLISSYFLSNFYYQKPIFLALIAGVLYILFNGLLSFFDSILRASNLFKESFYREIVFQTSRILVVVLFLFISFNRGFSVSLTLFFIILGISFSFLISLLFSFFAFKNKLSFLKISSPKINKLGKKKIKKFILPVFLTTFTSIFFVNIDVIMLGAFVPSEFIAFYKIPTDLLGAAIPLISLATGLFPLFSRMKGKKVKQAFQKASRITLSISFLAIIFILIFSPLIIKIIYGVKYIPSINILRLMSLLLISTPLTSLCVGFLVSQGKPKQVSKIIIFSTILNIILNLVLIKIFLVFYSPLGAIYGAGMATIISRYFYMFSLRRSFRKVSKGR